MNEEEMMKEKMEQQYGPAPKLDLSKVKNAKATSKVEGEDTLGVSKKIESKFVKKSPSKSKFCFTEEHEIQLPTNGLLYQDCDDPGIKTGMIKLRPMSLADEEIISNQSYIKNGSVFRKLLNSCVTSNIDCKELTPYDTYYLLYALRRITYGDDYKFEITCSNCGKKFDYSLNVSDLAFDELTAEDNAKSVVTLKLPVSKFTVTIKMITLGTEEEVNRLSRIYEAGDTVLGYVARTESILDTDEEPVNPDDYVDFYEALPGRDRAEITKAFEKIDNLKIPEVTVTCPKCGEEEQMQVPFNREFFRY